MDQCWEMSGSGAGKGEECSANDKVLCRLRFQWLSHSRKLVCNYVKKNDERNQLPSTSFSITMMKSESEANELPSQ